MANFPIKNHTGRDLSHIESHLRDFLPFAQERMEFAEPCEIHLVDDEENSEEVLGMTAYYAPTENIVVVYVTGRHPKDIMRSISHELVHHAQNLRGDLQRGGEASEGYAQSDEWLREMEREAYEKGNLIFRDWEDGVKKSRKGTFNESVMRSWNLIKENKQ